MRRRISVGRIGLRIHVGAIDGVPKFVNLRRNPRLGVKFLLHAAGALGFGLGLFFHFALSFGKCVLIFCDGYFSLYCGKGAGSLSPMLWLANELLSAILGNCLFLLRPTATRAFLLRGAGSTGLLC